MRTTSRHVSTDPNMLTFTSGQLIQVNSKGSGDKPNLWGGQVSIEITDILKLTLFLKQAESQGIHEIQLKYVGFFFCAP